MIQAVLFDLGGVYFEDGTKKFINILASRLNRSSEELYPVFRQGKSLEYRENKISGREFFDWASKQLESKIGPEELNQMWVSQYTEIPGVREIILRLKEKGITVGILSDNVPERVKYLEDEYNFIHLFDHAIFSYDVNLTKKDIDIFFYSLKKLGRKPEEVIFVDDRQDNLDIAASVGITPILFTDSSKLKTELEKILS